MEPLQAGPYRSLWKSCGLLQDVMEHYRALQNVMERYGSIAEALECYGALQNIMKHCATLRDVTESYGSVADRYGTVTENTDFAHHCYYYNHFMPTPGLCPGLPG